MGMLSVTFEVKDCGDGIFAITAPMQEQMYLVCGDSSAMLIDTGMGIGSLKEIVDGLTGLPVTVVNTHGHPDHAGGNSEFGEVWLHSGDDALYPDMCSVDFRVDDVRKILGRSVPEYENAMQPFAPDTRPLRDGQAFDLGGRILRVYQMRGHTHGSVMLHDSETNALFTGDTVSANEAWLYLDYCTSLQTYYRSLESFMAKNLEVSALYPGHLPTPVGIEMLHNMLACVEQILSKKAEGIPFTTFAGSGLRYEYNGTKLIYNPENL